jgi:penicillin-insensitive murein endopeptidase
MKLALQGDFFSTHSGKEIKRRGIYFAQNLPANVNAMYDDHYHVDFKIQKYVFKHHVIITLI